MSKCAFGLGISAGVTFVSTHKFHLHLHSRVLCVMWDYYRSGFGKSTCPLDSQSPMKASMGALDVGLAYWVVSQALIQIY